MEGQGLGAHVGLATRLVLPPVETPVEDGVTATELTVGAEEPAETVIVTLFECEEVPRVAVTDTTSVPAEGPAVKVTGVPLAGVSDPTELLADHA